MKGSLALALLLLAGCSSSPPRFETYSGTMKDQKGFFIIYGDTRDHDPREVWREHATAQRLEVSKRLVAEAPDFIVSTGDLVRCGALVSEWERFDQENAGLREKGIAYFPALGNHDYLGDPKQALSNFFGHFPALSGRKWYDLRYRGLLLLVLDSNVDQLAPYERELEAKWLDEQLDRAEKDDAVKWIVLSSHHTPYTNAVLFSDSRWVQVTFLNRARRAKKFRAYIAGHVHSYERFRLDGIDFVVSGGGGAPLNDVAGKNGPHPDLYDGPRLFHYIKVTVANDVKLETVMLDDTDEPFALRWKVVDSFRFE